ncbi:MAG: winged helix-turn-helix transcriptional regulator [Candidatus Marsarchaeota archaeon]|nr:winged helix-turn-helix transcriptional regulator [Candidatus Marsarchaeota archaeon]
MVVFWRSENTQNAIIHKTTPITTPKEDQILKLIKENSKKTKQEIAKKTGITISGVKYHIKKLKSKKLLSWKGTSRKGSWKVKEIT